MRNFRTTAMLLVLPTALAIVAVQGTAEAAPGRVHRHHYVSVVGDGSHVRVSRPVLHAGRVTFAVRSTSSTSGSNITLFRPKRGHTLGEVFSDLGEEFSSDPHTAAKGTRDLTHDIKATVWPTSRRPEALSSPGP